MLRRATYSCCTALLAALVALAGCSAPQPPFAQISGVMLDAQLGEVSGLAVSPRHPDTLWMVNDSGNPANVYAVSTRGSLLATLHLDGIDNTDWEDIDAFEFDGRGYLLVADTGDNGGLRKSLQLYVVEEPTRVADATVRPAWSIAFRWPDGPRDCEAVTVDAARGRILLVTKKRVPPQLFELPLRPASTGLLVARQIGDLAGVPRPSEEAVRTTPSFARLQSMITAADIAPDGHALAALTYQNLLVYEHRSGETWAQTVTRPPRIHALSWLPQPEALGWNRDSRGLYSSGEVNPAPILYLNP